MTNQIFFQIWTGFGHLFDETPSRFLRQAGRKPVVSSTQHQQSPSTNQHTAQPSSTGQYLMQLPSTGQYPGLTAIPATTFVCGSAKGKMVADAETSCQVGQHFESIKFEVQLLSVTFYVTCLNSGPITTPFNLLLDIIIN